MRQTKNAPMPARGPARKPAIVLPVFLALMPALLFCFFPGCAQLAPSPPAIRIANASYFAGQEKINAVLCEPANATDETIGVVLTGGDGITLKTMQPPCEEFAKMGFATLAHENSRNGVDGNVLAVVGGIDQMTANGARKKVALWGHSSGTIFSSFAAYVRPERISSFVETSGHMQIPICDTPSGKMDANCLAYWFDFPAPILIVHGLNDSVVNVSYAQGFSNRLERVGKAHRLLRVPNKGHEFMDDVPDVMEKEAEFIRQSAKGEK